MADTKYFRNKKGMESVENFLVQQCQMKLCYSSKKKKICKNKDIVVTFTKEYVSIITFDNTTDTLIKDIKKFLE